jgi:hypothetical protein
VRERGVDGREEAQLVGDAPPDGVVEERDRGNGGEGGLSM